MIISFEITNMDDLNLMVQLASRLGIKQVELSNSNLIEEKDSASEVNDEINDIFGIDNADLFL